MLVRVISVLVLLFALLVAALWSGVFVPYFPSRVCGSFPFTAMPTSIGYHSVSAGSLNDKVALVTGANIGLGYWTAHHLALKGATVVLACRSQTKCENAAKFIRGNVTQYGSKGQAIVMVVDMSSLASVQSFTTEFKKKFQRLDIFVQNAGIGLLSATQLSSDGIELIFAVNHLAHFKMTLDLENLITSTSSKQGMATIVMVSSASNFDVPDASKFYLDEKQLMDPKLFNGMLFYSISKLCNVFFAQELSSQLRSKNIYVNSVHPGVVSTNILHSAMDRPQSFTNSLLLKFVTTFLDPLMWSSEAGALTQFYLAAAFPELKAQNITGKYFHPVVMALPPNSLSTNMTLQKQLWKFSEKLLNDRNFGRS